MRAVQGMQSVLTHLHASHGSVDEHMASLADGGGHVGKKVPTHTLGGTVSACGHGSTTKLRLALWLGHQKVHGSAPANPAAHNSGLHFGWGTRG